MAESGCLPVLCSHQASGESRLWENGAAGEGLLAERTQRALALVWSLVHHERQHFWVVRNLCSGITVMSEILAALRTLSGRGDYLYWFLQESLRLDARAWLGITHSWETGACP